jgi:hypothetical protein
MNQPVVINGTVKGTVANLKARNLELEFNDHSRFKGNIDMEGLPDIDQTYIQLDIDELTTNKEELEEIPLPPFDGSTFVELPDNIAYLGQITYSGDFTGFISDFVTYGNVTTAIGNVRADITADLSNSTSLIWERSIKRVHLVRLPAASIFKDPGSS